MQSFKPNLSEVLNPTRYPVNLFRDDEMKVLIRAFRHRILSSGTFGKAPAIDFSKTMPSDTVNSDCIVPVMESSFLVSTPMKKGGSKHGPALVSMKDIH